MLHARHVILAECKGVEDDLRDVGRYGRCKQEREQTGKMALRHKEGNSGGSNDAQLRQHAAAMNAGRLHENQRCRGEKHRLIGGDNQCQRGKQLHVLVAVQSETAGEIGRGQHKAGEDEAQAHRAEILPFVGEGDAEHQQYHAHRQDGRGGKQREDISGDKIRHFALVSGLTYFNSYAHLIVVASRGSCFL